MATGPARTWPERASGALHACRLGTRPLSRAAAGITPAWLALAVLLAAATTLIGEPVHYFGDFQIAYYPAGVAVAQGETLEPLIHKGVLGFVNLPIVAYLFAPLTVLPERLAAAGPFFLLGLLAIVAAFVLIVRAAGLTGARKTWFLLLFAANGPLICSLKLGNTSHMVLAALAGSLVLLQGRRSFAAGMLVAAAALMKLPLMLFGLYFLLRRDWRATCGFGGVVLAAAAMSVALFGWHLHAEWFEYSVRQFSHLALSAFNVQSVPSFLLRLRNPALPLFDWSSHTPTAGERLIGSAWVGLLYLTAAGACLASALSSRRGTDRQASSREIEFLLVLCLAVVSSPLSWSHYYCWMLLPIAYFVSGRLGIPLRSWTGRACVAATILVTPVVILPSFEGPLLQQLYTKVIASNYLFGGMLWLAALAIRCGFRAVPAAHEPERLQFHAAGSAGAAGTASPLRER